jgi:fatty-acyl-CoA synthase
MKIAFSTLGCPGWSWEDIFATAKDLGFDGIEVRGVGNEMNAPLIKQFLIDNIEATKAKLTSIGLKIPMLTCAAHLNCAAAEFVGELAEIKEYIDLASILIETAKRYNEICEYGKTKGVTPLIETNGELADSANMAKLLDLVPSDNSGVLWDIHHPYRFYNEEPEKTIANLGGRIKYMHLKDSVIKNGSLQYRMMGYGDIPVLDALKGLKAEGFEGWVSLEWVKRWNPDLEEPGVVFSHFKNYMTYLINQL